MYKEGLAVDFGYLLPLYNISLQYQKLGTIDVELECLNLLVTVRISFSFKYLVDIMEVNRKNISFISQFFL